MKKNQELPMPDLSKAEELELPRTIINMLSELPQPTLLSAKSNILVYPKETRLLAAIIHDLGLSLRETARVVGVRTDHSVRTAVEAYQAGEFDDLVCPGLESAALLHEIDNTEFLQDLLDDAEEDLRDLQERYDALKRKSDLIIKSIYLIGYLDGQKGTAMKTSFL